jgi:hypothetical protein
MNIQGKEYSVLWILGVMDIMGNEYAFLKNPRKVRMK